MHSGLIERIKGFQMENPVWRLQDKIMMSVVRFLTHILKGVSSVCGYIDEEDTLAHIVAEVHGAIPI